MPEVLLRTNDSNTFFLQLRLKAGYSFVVVKASVGRERKQSSNLDFYTLFDVWAKIRLHILIFGSVGHGLSRFDGAQRLHAGRSVRMKPKYEDLLLYYQSDEPSRYGDHHRSTG